MGVYIYTERDRKKQKRLKKKRQRKSGLKLNKSMDKTETGTWARELPQEILEDVLLRLAVKSLVRFRSVSKPWLALITSHQFTRSHLKYHQDGNSTNKLQSSIILSRAQVGKGLYSLQSVGGGYTEDTFRQAQVLDCPLLRNEVRDFIVVCYCDGILCLVIDLSIVLWNPSTRESRKLPFPPYTRFVHPFTEIFGFGYDSLTNDYKLVRLPSFTCGQLTSNKLCDLQTSVLTLKTNSWRRIQDVPHYVDDWSEIATSFNGGLYWLVSTDRVRINLILHFDLAEETFREIVLPPLNEFGKISITTMLTWRGFLCVLCDYTLWVLGEAGAWTKLMTLPVIRATEYFLHYLEPLCFTNTGKVFIAMAAKKFVLYDTKERTYEKLDIRGMVDYWSHMTVYTESLISPGTGIVVELQH